MDGPLASVNATRSHQVIVQATLHDGPVDHGENLIGVSNGTETMSDRNRRSLLARREQVLLNTAFRLCIQSAAGFVEDEQAWRLQERSGE
ncbi:MAG: hypothetical protein CMB74_00450 [Euryarchaeota archaeon]|nr:hypothetical protein [Euryarchaeota archaeon]